jgi:two-component system OmpR family sensor kinase
MSSPVPRSWTDRLSLRVRLLAIVAGLLAAALALAGLLTVTTLRAQLTAQVDEQLRQASHDIGRFFQSEGPGPGRDGDDGQDSFGSSYVAQVWLAGGTSLGPFTDRPKDGYPDIGPFTADEAQQHSGEIVTVEGTDGHTWRAIIVPVRTSINERGAAIVALPLRSVEATLAAVALRFVVAATALLALLVVIGYFAVGRAFRPLRDVQAVALAFGAGDTSQRVAVAAANTEVGRLGGSVNAMLDQIESTLAAREASEQRMRRFVGDASHELRTPLAAVRGFAELYRMGAVATPADVRTTFKRIEDESTRMGGLVEDLLQLARLDEQRPLKLTSVDLLVLVDDAAHDATALAPDRQVRVTGLDGDPTAGSALTTGDEARLRQVVTNLMANAIRHTPAGSPVELGVGSRNGLAVVQVVDHGAGVPAQLAERIFERFYRADSSRSRGSGGGSGLGLAIVSAIVAAHGGEATVGPTPGGGATFEVRLPARTNTRQHPPHSAHTQVGSRTHPARHG